MRIQLMTANPESYVHFCVEHPVDMCDGLRGETNKGGAGDRRPPTPVAEEFFSLLAQQRGALMTQAVFADHCERQWAEWFATLSVYEQRCFRARLYRNFYPSFIDQLHVWSLLGTRYYANGALVFDRCLIDTQHDVHLKTDLMVYRREECINIGLQVGTQAAWHAHHTPGKHATPTERVTILLPIHARAKIGGKRWYHWPEDFKPLHRKVEQLHLFD